MKEIHTAKNVFQQYEDTVITSKIADKVKHVVTDNGANMLKAFSFPGYKQQDDSDEDERDDDDEEMESTFQNDPTVCDLLPVEQYSCYAHTLKLVIKDGFKKIRSDRKYKC